MSWSVSATGRAGAVAAKLAEDFDRVTCAEPEQTIKTAIKGAVATALGSFAPDFPVKVEASGSQSDHNGVKTNQLHVSVQPIWNFVE